MTDIDTIRSSPWQRVVMPGVYTPSWRKTPVPVFLTIQWQYQRNQKWELSIQGVEGPRANGDCIGGCGQITDFEIHGMAEGWTFDKLRRLREIWDRWHLNGMRAGSPRQEAYLREHPYDRQRDGGDHYSWARRVLGEAGLHPDPEFLHPTRTRQHVAVSAAAGIVRTDVRDVPYEYGAAWLYEDVPDDVLEFLFTLPKADRAHPWKDCDELPTEEQT